MSINEQYPQQVVFSQQVLSGCGRFLNTNNTQCTQYNVIPLVSRNGPAKILPSEHKEKGFAVLRY